MMRAAVHLPVERMPLKSADQVVHGEASIISRIAAKKRSLFKLIMP